MKHFAVIGAGITGITTAWVLRQRGYDVTVFDRHRYPAKLLISRESEIPEKHVNFTRNVMLHGRELEWHLKMNTTF